MGEREAIPVRRHLTDLMGLNTSSFVILVTYMCNKSENMTSNSRYPFASVFWAVAGTLAALALLPALSTAAEKPAALSWTSSSGNLTLLVLADSSAAEERLELDKTLLCALDHFGMPFQLFDLARETLSTKVLLDHPAVVIAQAGLGKHFSENDVAAIKEAVEQGVGLVNFDGLLSVYPAAYLRMLGIQSTSVARAVSVQVAETAHPVTAGSEPGRRYELVQPVEVAAAGSLPDASILLRTDQGRPAAFAEGLGKGRVVQFALPPKFWLPDYFGHVHRLDGVFWKSIVWAARKPFVMMAMPPFVTARIDDASGSGCHNLINSESAAFSFRYIDALNRHGYIPNIGLFTDDVTDEDAKVLKRKFDQRRAQFSAHAWTETRHIYINRVRAGKGTQMVEFNSEDLRQRFDKLDQKFAKWGIKPSKTVNSHCFSPGTNALPFLKERGETFMMFCGKFGKDYYDPSAFAWGLKPYGDPGFTCDYMPDHPDFFNAQAHPYKVSRDGKVNDADIDILYGNTTFAKESPTNRLARAAQRGAEAIRLGLDSLFFGCLFAHEQRIASLTVGEWEQVLSDIDRITSQWDRTFKSYDYISEYAKSRFDTKIAEASYDASAGKIRLKMVGKSTLPLKLYWFGGDSLGYEFREIPAFQGEQSAVVE
jgi:hypothetical protein